MTTKDEDEDEGRAGEGEEKAEKPPERRGKALRTL